MDYPFMLDFQRMKRIFEESYGRLGFRVQPLMAISRDLGEHLSVTFASTDPETIFLLRIIPDLRNIPRFIPYLNQFVPNGFEVSHVQVLNTPKQALPADQHVFLMKEREFEYVPRWQVRFRVKR
jgi:hypothetical protein